MALRGSFSDTAPEDLLQLLSLGGRTGVLSVTDGDRQLELIFENGAIIDAFDSSSRGPEVVFSLLASRSGTFSFVVQEVSAERTIDRDVPALLLVGATQLDDHARAQALLATPTARPYRLNGAGQGAAELGRTDQAVLAQIDGLRTIGEIAAGGDLDMHQVCIGLARLMGAGLAAVATAQDETRPLADAAPVVSEAGPVADRPVRTRPTADELREIVAFLRRS